MLQQKLNSFAQKNIEETKESTIQNIKKEALRTFEEKGFPTKKLEAWKYTSLNSVLKDDYQLEAQVPSLSKEEILPFLVDENHYRLVFINGVFVASLSKVHKGDFILCPMREAMKSDGYLSEIEKYWGKIADANEAMSALNIASANEGTFIKVKRSKAIETPIELLYLTVGVEQPLWNQPHNLIIAEENSEVKIIERHQNLTEQRVFTNSLTEIYTAKDAFVDIYKIQNDKENAVLVDNTYAEQASNSHASVHTFSFGGDIVRNNLNYYQKGEYMESTLKGITILNNRQHTDHYTLVNHEQPNCESHQDYKSILMGRSTIAFNGKIMVEKIAQKTNAYQQNDNILLSDKAAVYTKPQLEIFADDVKCSHGCTIGQLDADAIFYLQTRGIPKKEAEALLTYAFAHSVLSSVKIEKLQTLIDEMIAKKLQIIKN